MKTKAMKTFNFRKYLAEGWLQKDSDLLEESTLEKPITELVKELADEDGIVDLRETGIDLEWYSAEDYDEEDEPYEDAEPRGAWILSIGEDGKVYVSTGPEDAPMTGDDETLSEFYETLQFNLPTAHDADVFFDALAEALAILKEERDKEKSNLQEDTTEGWDETVAEHMWNTVLHWKAKKWITEEEADQIRDIIGA